MINEADFSTLGLSDEMLAAVQAKGFESPTSIQRLTIPRLLSGENDIIAQSQTGTGKTAAFGLPILQQIEPSKEGVQSIILVPTRELAVQAAEELLSYNRERRLSITAIYGGAAMSEQLRRLSRGVDIVVGTPGRVLDHMERKTLDTSAIRYLVIDEADEMLNMGFLEQVKAIISHLPEHPVTLLFSATMPKEIERLAQAYLHHPVRVEIKAETVTVDRIKQTGFRVEETEKMQLLKDVLVLQNPDSCIVFCNTQEKVDAVYQELRNSNIPCGKIHGGMEQDDRIVVMNQFRRGNFRYLIATDVAARGIDIDHVTHVINYDLPRAKEHYVHRIGRTGRNGRKGIAVTFYTKEEAPAAQDLQLYTCSHWIFVIPPTKELVEQYRPAFEETLMQKPDFKPEKGAAFSNSITKIHINAGRKTKMRPVDVVGTICSIKGVTSDDIGIIDVQSISTFVDILNSKGDIVLKALQTRPIKGRPRRVSRVND